MNKLTACELLEYQINQEFKVLQNIANQSSCDYELNELIDNIDYENNAYENVVAMLSIWLHYLKETENHDKEIYADVFNILEIYKEINY